MRTVTIWQHGERIKTQINRTGSRNSIARYVFRAGQCHSLALAIIKLRPDWEIWGLFDEKNSSDSPGHVVIRNPKTNAYLDINGVGAATRWSKQFGPLIKRQLTLEETKRLSGYCRTNIRAAMPFARRLLEDLKYRGCRNPVRKVN